MSVLTFIARNARWIAGGFLMMFFSAFGQTYFISLSAGEIRAEYGISHGQFGLIYMIGTCASALTLSFIGKVTDRQGAAQVVLWVLPLLALGALGMAFSTHVATLVIVIYMLRLFGQGMLSHNALTATGRWFAANRGRALSFVMLGHNTGEAIMPSIVVALFAAVGWRNGWIVAAIVGVTVALPLIWLLVRVEWEPLSDGPQSSVTVVRHWTRSEAVRDWAFWALLTGVLAPAFIGTTVFFHQVYLVELRGWSLPVFARSFAVMSVTTITFLLLSGWLIDRFSALKLLPVFLVPLAASCFVLALVEAQWGAFAFMMLMGVSYGFSSTLFGAVWPEVYGTKHLGAIRALVVAISVFATAAGPGLTGWLIDRGVSYPSQIMVMGIYCLIVCAVMYVTSRHLQGRLGAPLANEAAIG